MRGFKTEGVTTVGGFLYKGGAYHRGVVVVGDVSLCFTDTRSYSKFDYMIVLCHPGNNPDGTISSLLTFEKSFTKILDSSTTRLLN